MRVAVAYSGGRDSTALLHATLASASPIGVEVIALHVHHGLSRQADAWLDHCAVQCARWADEGHRLTFVARRLAVRPGKGESIEAWARKERYAALHAMAAAHDARLVLLAHHRRDQAETLLLQALRGAGVAGLAAMPRMLERDGITWARPWLSQPHDAIEAYVRLHRLEFIEDDSNAQDRFDRNRLRRVVWPHLVEAFPHAEASLANAASRAHDASSALDELAAVDLQGAATGGRLDLAQWSQLSPPRRVNALRSWLRERSGCLAPATLLTRLCAELPGRRHGRWLLEGGELRCHQGALSWLALDGRVGATRAPEPSLGIRRPGLYPLPGWGGALKATTSEEGGVPLALLDHLDLLPRSGGEQLQAGPGRPPRSLKKQYQAANIPVWKRNGPLVYSGERLIFVPGLGIDARALAPPGEAQVRLEWIELPH